MGSAVPSGIFAAILVGVAALAPSLAVGGPAQTPGDLASCGRPGQPLCPMQGWMKAELGAPLAEGKLGPVGKALARLEAAAPDAAWVLWRTSSRDGAIAAARNDVAGVRQSCRTCHDAYRAEYRKKYRTRPPP